MQEDNDSVNTMKNYLPDVEKFLTFINKDPIELDRIDVIKYINDLKNHELNAKTINRKIYAIYKFIQFLNNDYDLKINFNIKKLKMRIAKQEYGRDLLTKTDFKRILNAAYKDENIMFATLMLTLYLTGMRISEALNIKLKDIKKKEIIVTGKANKQRYIPIPDDLRKHFRECAAYRKDSKEEYLFLNKHGRRLTAWMADYYIKRYAGKTKVELKRAHCHNVRHLFGYTCINERGMTIDELAQIMGHSDINITKIYIKKTRKQLQESMKNFKLE
jgi:integrase/recombinase XerD